MAFFVTMQVSSIELNGNSASIKSFNTKTKLHFKLLCLTAANLMILKISRCALKKEVWQQVKGIFIMVELAREYTWQC